MKTRKIVREMSLWRKTVMKIRANDITGVRSLKLAGFMKMAKNGLASSLRCGRIDCQRCVEETTIHKENTHRLPREKIRMAFV